MRQGPVRSLAEGLREVGLDPDKALSEFKRTTSLVEARTGGGGHAMAPIGRGGSEAAPGGGGGAPETLDEGAFKIVKKLFKTAGEKVKDKLGRKKRGLAKLARQSRMYRKKNKRKIAKRQKKKLAKFGAKGLTRLHKMRKRITMSSGAPDLASLRESINGSSTIAQLREDIASLGNNARVDNDNPNPIEEAAFNAGLLAHYLGEVFEICGDTAMAESMYQLSDSAADLSEMLDGFGPDDSISEEHQQRLLKIVEAVQKGLRLHEEMGSPLVSQAMAFRLKYDNATFVEECECDDDEDDDDDDDDEDDEDEDDDE